MVGRGADIPIYLATSRHCYVMYMKCMVAAVPRTSGFQQTPGTGTEQLQRPPHAARCRKATNDDQGHLLPDSVELRTRLLARTPSSGCSCTYCLLRLSQWNLRCPDAIPSCSQVTAPHIVSCASWC